LNPRFRSHSSTLKPFSHIRHLHFFFSEYFIFHHKKIWVQVLLWENEGKKVTRGPFFSPQGPYFLSNLRQINLRQINFLTLRFLRVKKRQRKAFLFKALQKNYTLFLYTFTLCRNWTYLGTIMSRLLKPISQKCKKRSSEQKSFYYLWRDLNSHAKATDFESVVSTIPPQRLSKICNTS
jgi:hypothetical protein